jgi:hypothetical protein
LAASFESMAKSLDLYFNLDITSDEELACQMKQKMFLDKDMYEKILFNLCKCHQLINPYVILFLMAPYFVVRLECVQIHILWWGDSSIVF